MIRVKPAPRYLPTADAPPLEYVPSVPADGIELPNEEAERLLKAGLVVRDTKPTKEVV